METTCSARVRAMFTSRGEARARMDSLLTLLRRGGEGLRGPSDRTAEKLELADCYEYVSLTSSTPSYELNEAARLRAEVEAFWARS